MFIVLKSRGYLFFFIPEDILEPMSVHLESTNRSSYARFWLNPVCIARSTGFKFGELDRVTNIVIGHLPMFKKEWENYFVKRSKIVKR